jgi:hypothetical protein
MRYLFYFEAYAKLTALRYGLIEGNPDYVDFISDYVSAHMDKLPSDIKPDFL